MGQKDSNQRPPQELGHYWFVMYNRVQQSDLDTAARSKLTASHISYILSLRKSSPVAHLPIRRPGSVLKYIIARPGKKWLN
jgi:hypothetical protein